MVKVSAGCSRKLNLQSYGGRAYESEDLWISLEVEKDIPPGDSDGYKQAVAALSLEAKQVLGALVERRIAELQVK